MLPVVMSASAASMVTLPAFSGNTARWRSRNSRYGTPLSTRGVPVSCEGDLKSWLRKPSSFGMVTPSTDERSTRE